MKNGMMTLTMCAMVTALWLNSCTLPELSFAEELIEAASRIETSEANS